MHAPQVVSTCLSKRSGAVSWGIGKKKGQPPEETLEAFDGSRDAILKVRGFGGGGLGVEGGLGLGCRGSEVGGGGGVLRVRGGEGW